MLSIPTFTTIYNRKMFIFVIHSIFCSVSLRINAKECPGGKSSGALEFNYSSDCYHFCHIPQLDNIPVLEAIGIATDRGIHIVD